MQLFDWSALGPLASESHMLVKIHCCIVTYCPSTFKLAAVCDKLESKLCESLRMDFFFFKEFRHQIL